MIIQGRIEMIGGIIIYSSNQNHSSLTAIECNRKKILCYNWYTQMITKRFDTLRFVVMCCSGSYCVTSCCVVSCHVMLCYVILLCYVMLCYVMLCYVMLCYVMLCYVMLCLLLQICDHTMTSLHSLITNSFFVAIIPHSKL